MPAQRNAFKLGLAMILFVVLLVGVLFFLAPQGGGDMALRVRYPHTKLNTVLKAGGLVRCGGTTVGSIRSINLEEMKNEASGHSDLYSVLTITVNSDLGLRKDCKIVPLGPLLGEGGQLVIQDRGVGTALKEGDLIDGNPGADFTLLMQALYEQVDPKDPSSLLAIIKAQLDAGDAKSLLGKIHRSLDDINVVTQNVSREFDVNEKAALLAKFHTIMDHVNSTTQLLRDQLDPHVDEAIADKMHDTLDTLQHGLEMVVAMLSENRGPITQTVNHLHKTSEILEEQIAGRIARQLDPSDAASLLAKVHVAIDRLGGSVRDLNKITGSAQEMVTLNEDGINRVIANFKETSEHLNAAAQEVRASPWRIFYQPKADELAEAAVLAAARTFADAAGRLDDASGRLKAIEEARGTKDAASDDQLSKIREQLQQTFDDFTKAENALWKQLKIK